MPVPSLEPPALASGSLISKLDLVLPLALAAAIAAMRLYRIAEPAGIVFDELHFGKFVQWTYQRWFYFDIHPPLAKQTLALLAWFWGYDHTKCDYEPPAGASRMYGPECEYWKLRVIVALFSVAACVLMYPIARRLGASPFGATLAVVLEATCLIHSVEGRLVLLNTQLIFWLNLTLYGGLRWFARANDVTKDNRELSLRERLSWAVGVGFLSGNAFCVKHTGLATPGIVGVEAALGIFYLKKPLYLLDLVVFLVSMGATYTLYFIIHLGRINSAHLTLHQEEEFMSPEYQALLPGSKTYDATRVRTEGFWHTFVTLNKRMVVHSNAITQPHSWGTRPFDWLFNLRGVSYWGSTNGEVGRDSTAVYLFGNPVGHLAVFVAIVILFFVVGIALRTSNYSNGHALLLDGFRKRWEPIRTAAALCFLGWILNLAPYALIARTCFAYHYMPALVYGRLLVALLIDSFFGAGGCAAAVAAVTAAWVYWSPWVYALPLSFEEHAARRWMEKWN